MKIIKKLMQIALAVFFFGLLATSAVLADDADSEGWQFVQENGRTYYKKGDIKETAWRVIDGKPIILIIMVKWLLVGNTFRFHIKEVPLVLIQMVRGCNLFQSQSGTISIKMECYKSLLVGKH